jgi:hypothetical protein
MIQRLRYIPMVLAIATVLLLAAGASAQRAQVTSAPAGTQETRSTPRTDKPSRKSRARAEGETGKKLQEARTKRAEETSSYRRWKRRLPFWPRKGFLLLELGLFISLGVFIGQILEVAGVIRILSVLTWPLTRMGGLPRAAGPPFLMALQSGAVANSMLVSYRDDGSLNNRHLYTSVLTVSCLSLFAHLPTFVIPIGMAFGWEATIALFGVRLAAITLEIIVVMVFSNCVIRRWTDSSDKLPEASPNANGSVATMKKRGPFWSTVWRRSRKTLKRLGIYIVPTFALMATLEYYKVFAWLAEQLPGLFTMSFLPAQSAAIIPAQALSLYNGAIVAANFLDGGALNVKQVVLIILVGSLVTAPIRTLKHALPTYVAVLGPRAGMVLAISAQVLRSIFLILCILLMVWIWQ